MDLDIVYIKHFNPNDSRICLTDKEIMEVCIERDMLARVQKLQSVRVEYSLYFGSGGHFLLDLLYRLEIRTPEMDQMAEDEWHTTTHYPSTEEAEAILSSLRIIQSREDIPPIPRERLGLYRLSEDRQYWEVEYFINGLPDLISILSNVVSTRVLEASVNTLEIRFIP